MVGAGETCLGMRNRCRCGGVFGGGRVGGGGGGGEVGRRIRVRWGGGTVSCKCTEVHGA